MPLWSLFFDSHSGIIPVLTADLSVGFLPDYMKSTSKVSSDWKRQVAIFLWLVDERYNLGTTKTATSKASSSILEWNVKAVQAKKIIQFSTGFNYKEDLLSLRRQSLLISGDHCEKMAKLIISTVFQSGLPRCDVISPFQVTIPLRSLEKKKE